MDKKKGSWKQKLLLLTVSSFLVIGLLGVGEIYCRLFTRINFLDNSRGLFQYGRYGSTYGNMPNFEGISFGETFFIDSDGFRVDPGFSPATRTDAPAVLVMGDSVAFGPALQEDATIAGRLRRDMPARRIYNAAAIGYDTFDYKNAIAGILDQKPEIGEVLIFFCLNDVSDASAQSIRSQAPQTQPTENAAASIPRRINDYLRSRSKLYLWLKNVLVDTQMIHFRNDLANYSRGEKNVTDALQPIVDISESLKPRGVPLRVFITPYEAQLRPDTPEEDLLPQKLVTGFLAQNGIEVHDLTPEFLKAESPKMLFLFGDPMHLSEAGTGLVADHACSRIKGG